jgi:hypothetical protein|tara:strand:- start:74 stop:553 length:480 start_codon:yes stop_codon:yes gene_type:complete
MGEGDLYCSSAGSYPEGERKSATTKCKNEEIKMNQPTGQFQGDMDRNEVEIDLKKFMAMVTEIGELKQEIFELTTNDRKNPWQKWVFAAKTLDAWRIIPRAFLGIYMYLLYYATFWFMELPEPTLEQSGLISILVGAGAAWFGLYVNSAAKEHGDTNPN